MARTAAIEYDQTVHDYAAHRRLHPGVFQDLCQRGRLGRIRPCLRWAAEQGTMYMRWPLDTPSEEIIRRREILSGHFPETVEVELARYPRIAHLETVMAAAGLTVLKVVTVEQPYQVTSAQPFRDKAYSSLHLIAEESWRAGLERHLAHGPIPGVSRYSCVWGCKPDA